VARKYSVDMNIKIRDIHQLDGIEVTRNGARYAVSTFKCYVNVSRYRDVDRAEYQIYFNTDIEHNKEQLELLGSMLQIGLTSEDVKYFEL